jgi:hypothetical protein
MSAPDVYSFSKWHPKLPFGVRWLLYVYWLLGALLRWESSIEQIPFLIWMSFGLFFLFAAHAAKDSAMTQTRKRVKEERLYEDYLVSKEDDWESFYLQNYRDYGL